MLIQVHKNKTILGMDIVGLSSVFSTFTTKVTIKLT